MQTIQTAFTLGKTVLPRTAVLAPMAGVADRAYRLLCRSFGAAATVSEMVSVKGLCYGDKGSAGLCTITEPERPMGLQLFGSEPEFVGKAAALVQQYDPDWIDINMGCPVHKVVATGAGSALMRNIPLAQEIVRAAVRESSVPVTVKFRLGWDETSINAVLFAQAMEDAGAAAIAVHGRTKSQLYSGRPVYVCSISRGRGTQLAGGIPYRPAYGFSINPSVLSVCLSSTGCFLFVPHIGTCSHLRLYSIIILL